MEDHSGHMHGGMDHVMSQGMDHSGHGMCSLFSIKKSIWKKFKRYVLSKIQ